MHGIVHISWFLHIVYSVLLSHINIYMYIHVLLINSLYLTQKTQAMSEAIPV